MLPHSPRPINLKTPSHFFSRKTQNTLNVFISYSFKLFIHRVVANVMSFPWLHSSKVGGRPSRLLWTCHRTPSGGRPCNFFPRHTKISFFQLKKKKEEEEESATQKIVSHFAAVGPASWPPRRFLLHRLPIPSDAQRWLPFL